MNIQGKSIAIASWRFPCLGVVCMHECSLIQSLWAGGIEYLKMEIWNWFSHVKRPYYSIISFYRLSYSLQNDIWVHGWQISSVNIYISTC